MAADPLDRTILELQRRIRTAADPMPILLELGQLCLRRHRTEEVLSSCRQLIDSGRASPVLHFNYGWFAKQAGKPQLALDQYARALAAGIAQPEEVHLNRANIFSDLLLDSGSALVELETAIRLNAAYLPAWLNLGNLYEQIGDVEKARAAFSRCLDIDPRHSTALARLADSMDFGLESEQHPTVQKRLESLAAVVQDADLRFSLGRAAEGRGDYDAAWGHYRAANELDRSANPPYSAESVDRWVDHLIKICDASWLKKYSTSQVFSPTFICGSFRSGSTLLEQMLAAHSAFVPGGELEFVPRLVDREFPNYPLHLENLRASRVSTWANAYRAEIPIAVPKGAQFTDKRPDNLFYLGLIKVMFPRAKILVTLRDWRDSAVSIFATRLAPRFSYATDISDIRHQLHVQARLIQHWSELFAGDLQIVRYEELIDNPRSVLEGVLGSYGLRWEEECLNFHRSSRPVRTASVLQVRSPLHKNSVRRWQRFERYVPADL